MGRDSGFSGILRGKHWFGCFGRRFLREFLVDWWSGCCWGEWWGKGFSSLECESEVSCSAIAWEESFLRGGEGVYPFLACFRFWFSVLLSFFLFFVLFLRSLMFFDRLKFINSSRSRYLLEYQRPWHLSPQNKQKPPRRSRKQLRSPFNPLLSPPSRKNHCLNRRI